MDNAIWDLKGKLLERPVYELLGGPQKESIPCYASNTDLSYGVEPAIAWFLEVGFKAVKLFLTWGPEDGIEGIRKSEELVAKTREQIGPDVELMVDAWMSLNVEYIVRLMDALRPYRVKWLEDYPAARGHRQLHEGPPAAAGRDPGYVASTGTRSTRSRWRPATGWWTSSSRTSRGSAG